MKRFLLLVVGLLACSNVMADEIDYIEDFALAADRDIALQQLIPGTEEYYYYHALHYQNLEQFDRVEQLLQVWIKRFDYTPRVREIQNRQALLTYRVDGKKSLEYLQRTLNLQFNHQRERVGASPDLPTRLNDELIGRKRLMQAAVAAHKNLDGFENAALDWLVAEELSPDRRRNLLERLRRPDYPQLVELVLDDLKHKGSGGFGSLPIHNLLLLAQLDVCLKRKPDLLNQSKFVNAYLAKLRPNDDLDLAKDVAARQAHLDRLWTFVEKLAPTHNSLKVHVLYHRLQLDLERGIHDKPRFMAYIQMPRAASYVNRKYIEQASMRRYTADLNTDYRNLTLLPPVGNDAKLVQTYLQHFFLTETTYEPYQPFLNDTYLKHVFAETKIVNGLGDAEQWSSLLPPEKFQQLKQRVDIDFATTNRKFFAEEEPIRIDLYVKNVPTLIVKVYEINTYNYYRQNGSQVNTDINLDGLVCNLEQTHQYQEPALRRVARHFEFPELTKPGVYVIDFIGNGRSSRAVIRKSQLQYLARISTAGHVFSVMDEKGKKLQRASVWLGGREYHADEEGLITVPFSTRPGRQPIVLTHRALSSLDTFQHEAENYRLQAGIYVDRESLISRRAAKVLVRPALYLNGTPVTLSVLENVRLVLTSTDLDGIAATKEVADFELFEDRESIYEFQVPDRLATIQFTLTAKVQNLSQNKKVDLSAHDSFQLNGIDKTDKVEDLHLLKVDSGYWLELLGKTGEPRINRPVRVTLKHRDFKAPVQTTLRSDESGQVHLGPLPDIKTVTATGPSDIARTWPLRQDQHSYYGTLHGQEGQSLTLPYMGSASEALREELSLIELRGGQLVADRFESLMVVDSTIVLSDLPRGDYDLWLKRSDRHVRVKVAAGQVDQGYVLGDRRQLEMHDRQALQITRLTVAKDRLEAKLSGVGKFARVHVFASRYEPAYGVYGQLGAVRDREPLAVLRAAHPSLFASGRKLGDEYRYIIDRKYAARLPGNMLQRPSLLLNPWAVRKTETGKQEAVAGDDFAAETPAPPSSRARGGQRGERAQEQAGSPNLDFLATGAAVLVNLVPDEHGLIAIDRKELNAYQRVWVVAVDPRNTACRTIALPNGEKNFVDLRLQQGLDPAKHFTQQKRISVIAKGEKFGLDDIGAARFETYDSLAKVHSLMVTLSGNPTLIEFNFILDWEQLNDDEKREKYSKYACHELSFFLFHKDPDFFEKVVLTYLRNKKDKTFLDHWLLGEPLRAYLEPWQYAQLNTAERVLLARRVADELPTTRRLVGNQFDLLPPDVDRFNYLFDTAVQRSALSADDNLTREFAKGQAAAKPQRGLVVNGKLAAPSGGGMGGMGGMGGGGAAGVRTDGESRALGGRMKAPAVERLKELQRNLEKAPDEEDASFFARDRGRRSVSRRLYQQMDKTQEWAENNYYHLPIEQQNSELIKVNGFWHDLAASDTSPLFLSTRFAEATGSFAEMMMALSLLDLPLQSREHEFKIDGRQLNLMAKDAMIAYLEEIRPAELAEGETPILVSQNFFRHGDRYRFVGNQKVDKYVTDEFLVQTVYGCQVVVTNPTSSAQKLGVLLQIPQGAMPVLGGKVTRAVHMDLQPFHTATLEYYFYFPMAGEFAHYPVHVSKNEKLLACASPVSLHVVQQLSKIDRQSWAYVSQFGTNDDVLEFLKSENLQRIELAKIAFRMQDKDFFTTVVPLLAANHLFDPVLWSYAIKHDVPSAINVYLQHHGGFVSQCGMVIDSPLLQIDPVARKTYQHLDYRPLVNARAHQLGQRRQIVNSRFLQQYHALLKVLSYQRKLDDAELMAITYYMLLQDRVEEALVYFKRVNPENLSTRLQYDYFTAYLDFYTEDPKLAGPIVEKYADYGVVRWRKAFEAMAAQLDEIEGERTTVTDPEDRQQTQTGLAATEPGFDFSVESKKVQINFQNLARVNVNYYLMDIELLFSRNPFVQKYSGQFSTIRPNLSAVVDLPQDQPAFEFDLPKALHSSNVLVEITAAGKTRSQAYYANSLEVQVVETYGQLRVTHQETRKPLPKVYVKVYARMADGRVRFYKDGYTDLRGRFDYTSLNTNELDSVQRFALLVFSDEHGAVVREADPPKR